MEYTNEKPLKVITLCSGYDSQCLALERLKTVYPEFDYELIAWSEFDPENYYVNFINVNYPRHTGIHHKTGS